MNVDEIRTLYSYNEWATTRLLEATVALSAPDLARDLGTSHRSVKGTLVHVLWAEWIWLERWRGVSPKHVFADDDYPDLDAIASRVSEVARDQREFIAALTDDHLLARLSYENLYGERWEYTLGQMMHHVVNHSSYHRGQVVTLLRQMGHSPPPTDFLVFFDELDK
ncbi:MAG: DinB family protein [Gemmatimonadota bacterium]